MSLTTRRLESTQGLFWGMTKKEMLEAGEAEMHAENGAIRYYESLGFDPEGLDAEVRLAELRLSDKKE
jgi:hypothetical protein|tara:strand:- start:8 stop:211 length:204 start_codon:yes stop_codon:yes gene_type:complete